VGKNKNSLWVADETAAILLGSGRETKPQYDAENLTIFESSTKNALIARFAGDATFTESYNPQT
jgi:hypothetical protein